MVDVDKTHAIWYVCAICVPSKHTPTKPNPKPVVQLHLIN